ncbi:hypothetical protein HF521_021920 [Silurus meridionalis]|uniref:Rab-GAP TBC domain-containing protein n=1 Tax=Silurus meridionalis TaxID=175797 RepID=A0A8T0BCI3_SILME|nr:hypothetical protein HF521_021920 [Silurus meridionalis]
MEMHREDGSGFVLPFTVDVNENRAEGCRTHTLQPQSSHKNLVFNSAPKYMNSGVTSEETSQEINGFPEPPAVIEQKDGDSEPDTSRHTRTPGEPECFREINPNLNQSRNLHHSGVQVATSGLVNLNEEDKNLWGFCAGVRREGSVGNNGGLNTSGETSDHSGTHSSWFISGGKASEEGNNGPKISSGHTNTSDTRAADVFHSIDSTLAIGESYDNQATSAGTSGARGSNMNYVGETNANWPGRTMNPSVGEDAAIWEFDSIPDVIGESVSPGERIHNQETSGQWTCFSTTALEETSDTTGFNAVAPESVNIRGTGAKMATSGACAKIIALEETANIWRTNIHQSDAGKMVHIGESSGELTLFGETDGTKCVQMELVVTEETLQTSETNISPVVAEKIVHTEKSCATSGEQAHNRSNSSVREKTPGTFKTSISPNVADEKVDIGGTHVRSSTCREHAGTSPVLLEGTCENLVSLRVAEERAGTWRTIAEPVLGTHEKVRPLDVKTATNVAENLGVLPQDRVSGNSRLGNCFGKRLSSCCTELEMQIPNGELQTDEVHCEGTFPNKAPEKGVRVGNCGYLVINRRTVSGTPVYSVGEPWNTRELQQEARSTSNPGAETILNHSEATVNEGESEQVMETRPEDGVGAARPRSLRTGPGQGVSLSCNSTPLGEGNLGYFADDGDMDVIMNSLELGRRQSAPETLQESEHAHLGPSAYQSPNRRHGFTDFITRSLFSWKPRETKVAASGWRLFGKMSSRENTTTKESRVPQQQPNPVRRKNLEFEPLSTTGLILENRPANLPAKSEEEAQRHRQQYDEMMAGAKRSELKEAQRKKKQMKERHQQEEIIARALVVWNTEILPNWENVRNTRRVRDLWWQGLPPSIRGKIWSLAIGNELNITPELYEIFLSRAKEKWRSYSETGSVSESEDCGVDKESSLDLIKLDIFRTFPSLYIFQKGGPYHDILHNILGAYTCYRPDVGYMLKYFAAFEVFFKENLPKLFQHFQNNSLTPDFYLIDWIFTLYSKPLPLDVACRVWDLFCRDGEEALFRTALGILRLYQDVLLQMDFIHSAQFLSRLPQNTPAHLLFIGIANTDMLSNNGRWNQVFSALMKDGPKDADKTGSPALRS